MTLIDKTLNVTCIVSSAIASLKNHSSTGHHSYKMHTPSDGVEMPEQTNVNTSAPSGLLTDNPLYGKQQPESTRDSKLPDSMTSTLHELDNPLYGSGTNSDQIYSEPNTSYIQSPRKTMKNDELEPYAYTQISEKEDCSPHYDYASTSKLSWVL